MGFTVCPDKASGDILTEANWDTHIKDNFNTGVAVVLANSTLAAPAASIDFSAISQSWAHLMLVVYARDSSASAAVNMMMRFNGDTAANYDQQYMQGSAATASAAESFAQTAISSFVIPGASAGANLFGAAVISIPHYSQASNNKSVSATNGHKSGTATTNMRAIGLAGFWRSNAAITQITILTSGANLDTGSRATLYGLP